ncbi:hypothetical protein ANCCAN_27044 [Ancylostoma caninum]|uniref:Uncharacterized protein n=1 Tax=Ancylostoma caninum TaxID=29170 RepID=A0A368F568_ANCCA|nr:hypothetical protein ANCCAN_27044 [Ancylostoma caninum]
MQLQHAPQRPELAPILFKEVRCHLHDSRLAIVHGRPPKLLLYCDIHSAKINVDTNNMITIQPSQSTSEECFMFMCARSETFQRMFSKAMMEVCSYHVQNFSPHNMCCKHFLVVTIKCDIYCHLFPDVMSHVLNICVPVFHRAMMLRRTSESSGFHPEFP